MILKEPSENKYNHIPLVNNFNNWWYKGRKEILKYLITKENFEFPIKILEIGPGVGVNIEILQDFGEVDILEVDGYFIELINNNKKIKVKEIYKNFGEINKKYDLIVFLDVLEHIEDPYVFLNKINNVLQDNGVGILSVPAYQGLFSDHDVILQHFRRYNWQTLKNELAENFKITKRIGYNFLLLPIRFIQIKIIKSVVSDTTVNSFINKVLTLIVKFEVTLLKMNVNLKMGLSLFAVFRKKDAQS